MLIFIFGTTAEALKLSPILRRMRKMDYTYETWSSGQHSEELSEGLFSVGEGEPNKHLSNGFMGRNLQSRWEVLVWAPKVFLAIAFQLLKLKGQRPTVVVHGDTLTTLIGTVVSRFTFTNSVHVEAGLRSGDWRNPFPEELVRILVSRLANYHLAPGPNEVETIIRENPKKNVANVFATGGNTAVDNLIDFNVKHSVNSHEIEYGLVTIHRSEFIDSKSYMMEFSDLLNEISRGQLIYLVQDQRLKSAFQRHNTQIPSSVVVFDKMPFKEFMAMVCGAKFVITDSGGLQEEAAFLGIPTIIHRKATERMDGLGENVELSEGKNSKVIDFVREINVRKVENKKNIESPSDAAIKQLIDWGLIASNKKRN